MSDKIEIEKGHNTGSCFWIMPVKVNNDSVAKREIDFEEVEEMRDHEISIEEDDVFNFLAYFLFNNYDQPMFENKYYVRNLDNKGFMWNLDYNFYSYNGIQSMLKEIVEFSNFLKNNPSVEECMKKYPPLKYCNYNTICLADNILRANKKDVVIKFYDEFVNCVLDMMSSCTKCNLISFMGP